MTEYHWLPAVGMEYRVRRALFQEMHVARKDLAAQASRVGEFTPQSLTLELFAVDGAVATGQRHPFVPDSRAD